LKAGYSDGQTSLPILKKYIGQALNRAGLKKPVLRAYFFIINNWTGLVEASRKKYLTVLARQRSRDGVYAIDLDSDWLGLGARIVKTLEIALYCREKGLTPLIRYNYREDPGNDVDYFGLLFYHKHPEVHDDRRVRFTKIRYVEELGWPEDYNKKLKLAFAKSLFDQYFGINSEILSETDQFWEGHFGDKQVLGVHHRGTDKAGEAPLVAKEQLLERILTILRSRPNLETIFLSTDDEAIIHFLTHADLPVPLFFRQDAVRSNDGDQFHRKKEVSKSIVNRDAIVNMLLLSRCRFLLKTASILSDCSVIFNPAIEIDLINRPHSDTLTWWPCKEIIDNRLSNGSFNA
jgi:hypothetical protein